MQTYEEIRAAEWQRRKSMFKMIAAGVVVFVLLLIGSCSLTKVGQGHVGVKVNNIGSQAGVDPVAKGVGWYFTPPGVTIYEYPIFTNNYAWEGDDRFIFQDKNGLSVSADVAVAYRADRAKAPVLFQKYRTNMEGILQGPVRNTLRNAIVSEASQLTVDQIYGKDKAALIERARVKADKYLSQFGLHIEQLFWSSNINLPENIQNQINARVANEQQAIAEQAKVASAEAQARQRVAQAEGKARALQIENEAIANNKDVLELRAIEKWNGQLPTYMGTGQVPFIKVAQ
jgi:regulator of protease activity HflC (stomatin/prohibitin superfamily)